MKFSFQTVCILFLVTLVHLVLISAFSAMTGSSSTILSDLKADAILEELVLQASSSGEVPESKSEEEAKKEGSLATKSLPDNPLKTIRQENAVESLETPLEPALKESSSREAEPHDAPAIADARLLSGRIASPNLNDYRPRPDNAAGEESKAESKKSAPPVAPRAEVIAKPVAKSVPAPLAEGARTIRSIRPIPRS